MLAQLAAAPVSAELTVVKSVESTAQFVAAAAVVVDEIPVQTSMESIAQLVVAVVAVE